MKNGIKIFDSDGVRGDINLYTIEDSVLITESELYPSIEFKKIKTSDIVNPILETTMSLRDVNFGQFVTYIDEFYESIFEDDLFFFCYNFENYYHFIYDTLPYLISYFELKKNNPFLKLLIPNIKFNEFVTETFELLNIKPSELITLSKSVLYKKIYFSDSYTHGDNPNLPPHAKHNLIYEKLKKLASEKSEKTYNKNKIYISRRSWIHGNESNIGTNYTDRRVLTNETDVVRFISDNGYSEVFTENMSMVHKINLFHNADYIIGPIGGGLVNCIFSKPSCKLLIINSPTFFDINERFKFSFKNLDYEIFEKTTHVDKGKWKRFQRVKVQNKNIVGEILKFDKKKLQIQYIDKIISGFKKNENYLVGWFDKNECIKLDNGLNSPFIIDLEEFKSFYFEKITKLK